MKKKTTLVLSGGGTKGLAHLGAIYLLEQHNLFKDITTIACASAGAIIGSLKSIGYCAIELRDIFMNINFSKMKSPQKGGIFAYYGVDNGVKFMKVIQELFINKDCKCNVTFEEHYKLTGIKLVITGSCLEEKKCYYFSHESYPNMSVIAAIRISIAFPLFFTPVIFEGKHFSDGGCIDNYPICLFYGKFEEVIGIYLADEQKTTVPISSFEQFMLAVLDCVCESKNVSVANDYGSCTIIVRVSSTNFMDFEITSDAIMRLFTEGYTSAKAFIESKSIVVTENVQTCNSVEKVHKIDKQRYDHKIPFKKLKKPK